VRINVGIKVSVKVDKVVRCLEYSTFLQSFFQTNSEQGLTEKISKEMFEKSLK
jgi:hypothetical protein